MNSKPINWREVIVTDITGHQLGTLGEFVSQGSRALTQMKPADPGSKLIVEWPGYLIAAPGEEPKTNTPQCPVDWTDFREAIRANHTIR